LEGGRRKEESFGGVYIRVRVLQEIFKGYVILRNILLGGQTFQSLECLSTGQYATLNLVYSLSKADYLFGVTGVSRPVAGRQNKRQP
jgi:hypothetical protein